jgi:hypothetical protein
MLDIKYIRDNVDLIKKGARDKRNHIDLDDLERRARFPVVT